jgi:hypothetical protein
MIVLCVGSLDPRLFGIMLLTPSPDPGRICYDEEIEPMLQADQVCNAVATTKDGRIFVGFPHLDGSPGVKVGGVTTKVKTLIQDRRLIWVDAMWIDDEGSLCMPAAQLDPSHRSSTVSPKSSSRCTSIKCRSTHIHRRTIIKQIASFADGAGCAALSIHDSAIVRVWNRPKNNSPLWGTIGTSSSATLPKWPKP